MATVTSSSIPAPGPFPDKVQRKPRAIILCFDGTANEYDATNTNVVKLYSLFRKDKVEEQVCYYQAGVGTYFSPGVVRPVFRWIAKIQDEAVAWYLSAHVIEGYKFLMQNYNVGDKVYLFGFSRGAYTARALAGMLHKVGLLSKDNVEQVTFAYKLFKSTSKSNEALAAGFKATFSRAVPIEFVGVWDTVASVGIVMGRGLPFVGSNTTIRVFRHALSLDEHRTKFRPNLYHRSVPASQSSKYKKKDTGDEAPNAIQPGSDEIFETDIKEVWFAGCHSDVGGGNVLDSVEHSLANIPLRWMIEQIVQANCSILFDWDAFARWNIPTTLGQHKGTYQPPEQGATTTEDGPEVDTQDAQDAVQRIYDQLKRMPLWWILEFLPFSFTYQNQDDKWVTTRVPNFGRGRSVPPDPLFHKSVRIRERDSRLKYKPRAHYEKGTEHYVD